MSLDAAAPAGPGLPWLGLGVPLDVRSPLSRGAWCCAGGGDAADGEGEAALDVPEAPAPADAAAASVCAVPSGLASSPPTTLCRRCLHQ